MSARTLKQQHPALRDDIADLTTRRPLPGPAIEQLDPFLMLNHHGPQVYPPGNHGLPFGPHPHRGFETVTFILEGELAHRDSGGHESIIRAGGVQWMTAGRGIVHAELSPENFKKHGGPLEILQLWVNLPARLKMAEPRYIGLQENEIPAIRSEDGRAVVHLISGNWGEHTAPVPALSDVAMTVVTLEPGGRVRFPVARGRNVFLYVARGELNLGGQSGKAMHLLELNDDGDEVEFEATTATVAVFGHATPLKEPVVAYGPFVMNTQEEIRQAVRDYQEGKLGRLEG